MQALDKFDQAILAIYEAAADDGAWVRALGLVEEVTGSGGAIINLVHKDNLLPPKALVGERMAARYDVAVVQEYNEQLAPYCPRLRSALQMRAAQYLCDYDIIDERQMGRDPVYDWYTRHDARYFIGSRLIDTAEYEITWSVQRTNGQQHAQAGDIALFLKLKPHLQKALQFAGKLGALREGQALKDAIFDGIPYAVWILESGGRVITANQKAELFLRDEDGIGSKGGKLILDDATGQAMLEKIVGACMASSEPASMQVARPSGRLPYILSARALSTRQRAAEPMAAVIVTVQDMAARSDKETGALIQLFGFTRAEAALANAIAAGHSLSSFAHSQGISSATARVHLKSIFRKAGVNRQADLVRIIASVVAV